MASDSTKPYVDRSDVRIVLLLILLIVVAAWGYLEYLKPVPQAFYQPKSPEMRETVVNGVPLTVLSDVPFAYVPGVRLDQLRMDLFIPPNATKAPMLIYLHGGGWQAGDKSGIGPKGEAFATRGIVVASVNYRLAPVTPSPNACDDIPAAIAMLRRMAPTIGADPDRIFIMGHSAGAHLGALTAADEHYLARYPGAAAAIRGIILLDGSAYHVPKMMQSQRGRLFDTTFGNRPAIWTQVSPYHFAQNRKGLPPMLLAYAGDDPVRAESANELADVVRRNGGEATVISVPDKTHESIDSDLGMLDDPLTQRVLEFIR